jgi:uncharacterized protein
MYGPLPERINAERLAGEHTRLAGEIPLKKMPRLARAVMARDAGATLDATFALGADGRASVTGEADTTVRLTCQRCLQAVDWSLRARFALMVEHDDAEAAAVPAEYDPLLWPDDTGSLAALVEDELLLALPAVARHPDAAQCGEVARIARPEAAPEERRDNPFAVLEQLKRDPK